MNPTNTRAVDPLFDNGPTFSEADLARIFVDDCTKQPQLNLEVSGGPSRHPDHVSRPIDPKGGSSPEGPEFDPSMIKNPLRDIGLWVEEGSDSPLFRKHEAILPEGFGDVAADLRNGGPDAISEDPKKKFLRDSGLPSEEKQELQQFDKPEPTLSEKWENFKKEVTSVYNQVKCVAGGGGWACTKLGGGGMVDPEQSRSSAGFDPHAMIKQLLGDGSVLPDDLGIDLKLVGRLLGDKPEGTLVQNAGIGKNATGAVESDGVFQSVMKEAPAGTQAGMEDHGLGVLDKFADFLRGLDGIDTKKGGLDALDAFIKGFGMDGLDAALREFLPHINLEAHAFKAVEDAEATALQIDKGLLSLLSDKPLDVYQII